MRRILSAVRSAWVHPGHRFLVLVSLVYTGLFVVPHYSLIFQDDTTGLLNAVGLSWFATIGLFTLTAFWRWTFQVVVVALFLVSGATLYFLINYHVYLNENVVAVLSESNVGEALGYVSLELVLFVLGGAAVGLALVRWHALLPAPRPAERAGWMLQLAVLYGVLAGVERAEAPGLFLTFSRTFHTTPPISLIQKPALYLREQHYLGELLSHRRNIAEEGVTAPAEPLTVVLVLGESARADHFHINGYPRQTTPNAEAWGMQTYRQVRACANGTRLAIPCLMTRATPQTMDLTREETSLVTMFRTAGYRTDWISNQGFFWSRFRRTKAGMSSIYAIALEAEHTVFNNPSGDVDDLTIYDEELLPELDRALAGPESRRLVVLHTVGSHWHCDAHYPPSFARWTPVCRKRNPKRCAPGEYLNSYDNSLRYTDYFLGQVMERLKGRNAFLLYVSDHGAELGEHGVFTTTPMSGEEVMQVPLLVWMSDDFKRQHPERAAALALRERSPLSHDWVFHSLLDCAGLASPVIDPGLSLCRGEPR